MSTRQPSTATSSIRVPLRHQLRWRLILVSVILAVLPLGIVHLVTLSQTSAQSQRQVLNQLESVAELKQHQIDRWLYDAGLSLRLLALDPAGPQMAALLQAPTPALETPVDAILNGAVGPGHADTNQGLHFSMFFLYTPDGRVVASSDEAQIGKVVSHQPYFAKSLAADYIQPPYYALGSGSLVMYLTHPLVDGNKKPIGVLAGQLDLDTLGEIMLERSGLGESGETYLVSLENNYLLTPSRFADYPIAQAYHSAGIDQALRGQDGSGQYDDYRTPSVPVLGVYRWVPGLQAALIAEIDVSEALATSRQARNLSIALASLASLLAIVFGLYMANRIARPVVALTAVADQITAGDLQQRAAIREHNEIGVLARAFNSMTDQLQQTQAGLEQRVAERTADLEQALENLERTLSDLRESSDARDLLTATIREMSSPVVPVLEGILVMPLIGVIDSARAASLIDSLLQAVERQRARIVILDVTGVPLVDTQVARVLFDAASAARLLGARVILVGLRPELAQTMVGLGVDLAGLTTLADLQSGVQYALRQLRSGRQGELAYRH